MFGKGFDDRSSMRQVLHILKLVTSVLVSGFFVVTQILYFVKRVAYMCVKTTVDLVSGLGKSLTLKSPPQGKGRESDQVNTLQHTLHRPKLVPRAPRHHRHLPPSTLVSYKNLITLNTSPQTR